MSINLQEKQQYTKPEKANKNKSALYKQILFGSIPLLSIDCGSPYQNMD